MTDKTDKSDKDSPTDPFEYTGIDYTDEEVTSEAKYIFSGIAIIFLYLVIICAIVIYIGFFK